MRRWRIGLPVVAVGLLLAGCGVAHERSARSVVPDTPVGPGRLDRRQLEPERIPDELVERRRSLSDPSHDHGRALPRVSPARSLGEHAAARAMRSGDAPMRDGMAGEARLGGPEDRH